MTLKFFACCAAVLATTAVTNAEPPIVTFSAIEMYATSFQGQISIRNPASNPAILNWQLQFNWAVPISSAWDCEPTSLSNPYVLTHTPWVTNIDSGSTVTMGFMASGLLAETVSNCTVNGAAAEVRYGGAVSTVQIGGVAESAWSFDMAQGVSTKTLSLLSGARGLTWSAFSNNPAVCNVAISGNQLTITGVAQGFAGIRIEEAYTGSVRNIGIAVRLDNGAFPRLPKYFAFGTNGEDRDNQLSYFRNFGTGLQNRRVDVRYMYLNGGPLNGWATEVQPLGSKARNYIKRSKGLGFIPCFVFYNVPDDDENFAIDSVNLSTASYMSAYYENLMLFLSICKEETTDGWPVMIIFEPDSLGYMSQNAVSPTGGGWPASGGNPVQVATAYTTNWAGQPILQQGTDPAFANTLQGFVQSVNYITQRELPTAHFGWQFNLWASKFGGYVVNPPAHGLMHLTDTGDFAQQVTLIQQESAAITAYYVSCGVASYGATMVVVDKYGLDGGAGVGAPDHPEQSTWFWNADQWNNYLQFVKAMHDGSHLPVVLWQLPCGHINTTQEPSASGGSFPLLTNEYQHYEDSAPDFFLGDTFVPGTFPRLAAFSENKWNDPRVRVDGDTIEWESHAAQASAAGASMMLFGPGIGQSTACIPPFDGGTIGTDGGWLIQLGQSYLMAPYYPPIPGNCVGDVNQDGGVAGDDLAMLLNAWDTDGGSVSSADINGDGSVDSADLLHLVAGWGDCTP